MFEHPLSTETSPKGKGANRGEMSVRHRWIIHRTTDTITGNVPEGGRLGVDQEKKRSNNIPTEASKGSQN